MVRDLAFDIAELGMTTYLTALDAGVPLVALPIFPHRDFPHRSMLCNAASGVGVPRDLEGKRVGGRTYTVTGVVWARAVLAEQYGVDVDRVTWVVVDQEHVASFAWPPNVDFQKGADLAEMLAAGEIAAGCGVARREGADVKPLIADVDAAEREWFVTTGVYPINHVIAVRRDRLEEDPALGERLMALFEAGKARALAAIDAGPGDGDDVRSLLHRRDVTGGDPLPYGIEANRVTLESLLVHSRRQRVFLGESSVEDLFSDQGREPR